MATTQIVITTPVGRMVQGNLYVPNDKDFDGNPMTIKSGPDIGKPTQRWFIAVAIKKEPGHTHWSQTEWGTKIWALGHAAFPGIAQRPDFAWKIIDGDSQIPNKKNRKPCDNEGFPGNWVINMGQPFAPRIYEMIGEGPSAQYIQHTEPGFIVPGYYVQVCIKADKNTGATPGLYLNPDMVLLRAPGPIISMGLAPGEAGFGAPLPPGVTTVPTAAAPLPLPPSGSVPIAPAPAPVVPVQVAPDPTFVQIVPVAPVIPVAPVAPVKQMTAAANGIAYEAYIAQGWTDALLIQHGMMLP